MEHVGIHGKAHTAARLPPFKSRLGKDPIESFGFRLLLDEPGAGDHHGPHRFRNALAFALVSADQDKYFNDLANALDSRQANQAEAYLYELGKYEGKLPELHRYLQSSSPKIRAKMAHVIGNIGDPASRPLIEALTKDKDSEVVTEAVIALRKLTPA